MWIKYVKRVIVLFQKILIVYGRVWFFILYLFKQYYKIVFRQIRVWQSHCGTRDTSEQEWRLREVKAPDI